MPVSALLRSTVWQSDFGEWLSTLLCWGSVPIEKPMNYYCLLQFPLFCRYYSTNQLPLETPRDVWVWTFAICSPWYNSAVWEGEMLDFTVPLLCHTFSFCWFRATRIHGRRQTATAATAAAASLRVLVGLIKGERIVIQRTHSAVPWDLTSADFRCYCRLSTITHYTTPLSEIRRTPRAIDFITSECASRHTFTLLFDT